MIVQCEKCESKFNLDPSLVKATGTIVRCGICKAVFVVHPEFETEAQPELLFEEPQREEAEVLSIFESPKEEAPKTTEREVEEPAQKEKQPIEELLGEEPEAITEPEAPEKEVSERVVPKETKEKKGGSKALKVLLVVLPIVLLMAAGAVFMNMKLKGLPGLQNLFSPQTKEAPDDPGNKKLSLYDVSGKFVRSEKSGNLFVVTGTVKNKYNTKRSHILVRANLVDEKGNVLKYETAYAGNIISEKELQTGDMEQISSKMKNREGDNNSNVNVPPNGTLKFMIVFKDIPQNVTEFTVQGVESKPAELAK
jgi:predicted Zn finger-like uncharacterized protein